MWDPGRVGDWPSYTDEREEVNAEMRADERARRPDSEWHVPLYTACTDTLPAILALEYVVVLINCLLQRDAGFGSPTYSTSLGGICSTLTPSSATDRDTTGSAADSVHIEGSGRRRILIRRWSRILKLLPE